MLQRMIVASFEDRGNGKEGREVLLVYFSLNFIE